LCDEQGIKVLFVPQVLLEEVLKTGNYNWWIPYVPISEMDDMMVAYNSTLKSVSEASGARYASGVLNHAWEKNDFVDMSHFTGTANRVLAEIIAKEIREELELTLDLEQ
jgi:hypothetical protein